jgi:hypothetical protein
MSWRLLAIPGVLLAALSAGSARAQTPDEFKIDKDRFIFSQILDNTAFQNHDVNPSEYEAYNTVLLHARQFDAAALLAGARRDVTFKDLLVNPNEYRLELVAFEGRMRMLRRSEPPKGLKESGIQDLYEGWITPFGASNMICVVCTELPAGLEPQKDIVNDRMDRWVAVAGYPFKIFQYESSEPDRARPGNNKYRKAPQLLAKTLQPKADPTNSDPDNRWQTQFSPGVLGGVTALGVAVSGLAWWFRRGDRAARQAIEERRETNPFPEHGTGF